MSRLCTAGTEECRFGWKGSMAIWHPAGGLECPDFGALLALLPAQNCRKEKGFSDSHTPPEQSSTPCSANTPAGERPDAGGKDARGSPEPVDLRSRGAASHENGHRRIGVQSCMLVTFQS